MSLRKALGIVTLLSFAVLLLSGCNPVVQRTQTTIHCCSVCGIELSRTEQEITLRKSELPGFEPVIEDHTGICPPAVSQRVITTCPDCGRWISADWLPVSSCARDPGTSEEEIIQVAASPCPVCQTWDAAIVAAEPADLQGAVIVVGPYESGANLEWAGEDIVWARAGYGGSTDLLLELKDGGTAQGWGARRLLAWPNEGGLSLYTLSPVLGGRSLLVVVNNDFWLGGIPRGVGGTVAAQRLGQGLIAKMSPDLGSAVLYTDAREGEPPLYYDFEAGQTRRWTAVPNSGWPTTGAGSAWSPGSDYYLYARYQDGYQYFTQPVPVGSPVPVSQPGETAFFGQWSPDGQMIAYTSFNGDPSPYFSSAGDLPVPVVWEAVQVWSLAERRAQRLAVPDRWVLSSPACWSPDGRAIAFSAGGINPPDPDSEHHTSWGDVYVSRLTESGWSAPAALTEDGKSGHTCLPVEWSPDGRSLLISVGSSMGTPAERRVVSMQDGLTPVPPSVLSLAGARAANWLTSDTLVVVTRDADDQEQLEIRSVTDGLIEILDRPQLAPGQLSSIQYKLSPLRTRIAWTVQTMFRYPNAQELKLWVRARRLAPG